MVSKSVHNHEISAAQADVLNSRLSNERGGRRAYLTRRNGGDEGIRTLETLPGLLP